MEQLRIKENSLLAMLAAKKLRCSSVAMVLGRTIHLHNTRRDEFLKNERWVKHELCHIQQYKKFGVAGFLIRYAYQCARYGYYNSPFEKEARAAEEL